MSLEQRIADLAQAVGADVRRAVLRHGPAIAPHGGTGMRRGIGPMGAGVAGSQGSVAGGYAYYWPALVPSGMTVAKISAWHGGVAGTSGTGWMLGLYDTRADGGPGTRIAQSGRMASVAYAELAYTLGTPITLPGGIYWVAWGHDYAGTAPTVYGTTLGSVMMSPLGYRVHDSAVYALRESLTAGWSSLPAAAGAPAALLPISSSTGIGFAPALLLEPA